MIVDMLLASAERGGSRPAVADPFRSLDYGNLVRFADVMRRQVEKATTKPHVGVMLPSTCASAGTLFGVLWADRVAVPLNFLLQPAELLAVVQDSGIDVVFTIKHFKDIAERLPVKVVYIEDLPLKREMVLERIRRRPPAPRKSADDLAILLYTSGTSGLPKGARQTHGNLRCDVEGSIEHARLQQDHGFIGVLPHFHSFGLTAMLLVPIALGASVYYLPRFQPMQMIDTIRERRSSVTIMIASMFAALLKAKKGGAEDFKSIEYAVSGGEPLSPDAFARFHERYGVEIVQGYGMTEASPIVSLNVPWDNKVGTVGRAIPKVTVQAYDGDERPLPPGEIGELWVRGPIIMDGYHNKPDETRAVLTDDGWYKTGDMGVVDAEGRIAITGRKKEMIIVGGENVYPREIELALEAHSAVNEASAIGQADASRGEVVVAFVTLLEGQHATDVELREFCRDKIAGYKVPRRVIIAEDLPRGATGKILKRELPKLL